MSEPWSLEVESGLSLFDQKPFVNIIIDGDSRQVRPAKAREIAMMLLECAEASVHEAVLFELISDGGMDKDSGAQIIVALRELRAKHEEAE